MHLSSQEAKTIARYLEHYAEPAVNDISLDHVGCFQSIIVLPIFDESPDQLQRFLDFNNGQVTLMIWVFNAPESAKKLPALARTQKALLHCLELSKAQKISSHLWFFKVNESLAIVCVDRCTSDLIPEKQGVGLARKLGMDIALSLIQQQYSKTAQLVSWIHSTDADVQLPQDYALLSFDDQNISACVYPFQHTAETGYEKAMKEYEFSLHYYVESLRCAGSPYAFHTIGSLIAVAPLAYAQVRGMPKRSGAEDFYLLNKLQKVGKVKTLQTPDIGIAGRPSHRVPFGTGPALIKIHSLNAQGESLKVYHPRIFFLLKVLLTCVSHIEHRSSDEDILLSQLRVKLGNNEEELNAILSIFDDFSWPKQAKHLSQQKTALAIQQAFHTWFDAFLTLRFIHECRDRLYPNIELTNLPSLLDAEGMRGNKFDYTAWFNTLGISS